MPLQRKILILNGLRKDVLYDPQLDSLVTVIRRLGLTGTKVGCGTGQCGACSLILDGQLIRSCTRKMKNIPDFAKVETIEGLGTKENLHPLQQAFITHASVQCGFCSPGFIMSAKALLDTSPSPSRQDIRDWFTKNNNICRCTGYKPIVDAVMAAAAVMRGEKTMADICFVPPKGSLYGSNLPKPAAESHVTGNTDFGADLAQKMPPQTLHLAPVIAKTHHATIKNIDTSAALAMCGVVKVITYKDVKGTNRIFAPSGSVRYHADCYDQPIICDETVRRYGDIVAVVAARSREQAREAAAAIKVEYEALPPLMHYVDAAAGDAARIHKQSPNVYLEQPVLKGEDTQITFKTSPHIVEGSFSSTRQPHLTIEPDVAQAYPQEDGVTIQCKSQFLYGNIACMADAIGLPKEKIRIILNPAGASFGYTMSPANYALVAVCALAVDAPVSLELSYAEHQHCTGKRSPLYVNARMACTDDGTFTAIEYHGGVDHGAYSGLASALTSKISRFFGVPYNVPNIRGLIQTAFTNNNYGTAYRAFGSPQAYTASEQLVDMLAEKIGMDPFDLRYKNLVKEGDLSTNSVPYRVYSHGKMMDMLRPHYDEARANAAKKSTPEKVCGVGIAWGGYHVGRSPDRAEVDLELTENGLTCYSTWADMGQGADVGMLTHTHEALRPLNIQVDQIRLVLNDTGVCPDTGPASGSRSHHVAGMAIIDAARQLMDAMAKDDGSFRTWQEMNDAKIATRYRGVYTSNWPDIHPDTGHGYGALEQTLTLFMAEVTVDVATGETSVDAATIIADVGPVGNYPAVLGQAWGAFSHSVGFALSEDYNDVKKHATMLGAGVPLCNDVPDNFRILFHLTPRENAPYGSTGCAEGFQSAGHVAILNGIANAVKIRIFTLPATKDKVLAAIKDKAAGKPLGIPKWDLGCSLHDRLAWMKDNPYAK